MPRKKSDEVTKPKRRSGAKLGRSFAETALALDDGDNAKYLSVSLQIASMPKIDITNEDEVNQRMDDYFRIQIENDLKPTVVGMAMALGISRQELWAIKTGNYGTIYGKVTHLPQGCIDSVKKGYRIMENLWENYMQNGKINPVSGIFLGKNNYGYRDQTEYVLTPNSQKDEIDAEGIRKRYLQNPDVIDVDED